MDFSLQHVRTVPANTAYWRALLCQFSRRLSVLVGITGLMGHASRTQQNYTQCRNRGHSKRNQVQFHGKKVCLKVKREGPVNSYAIRGFIHTSVPTSQPVPHSACLLFQASSFS